eukprot:1814444-Pyramimonas_sp.AAC.1
MSLKSFRNAFLRASPPYFSISAAIPLVSAALPVLSCRSPCRISSSLKGAMLPRSSAPCAGESGPDPLGIEYRDS